MLLQQFFYQINLFLNFVPELKIDKYLIFRFLVYFYNLDFDHQYYRLHLKLNREPPHLLNLETDSKLRLPTPQPEAQKKKFHYNIRHNIL